MFVKVYLFYFHLGVGKIHQGAVQHQRYIAGQSLRTEAMQETAGGQSQYSGLCVCQGVPRHAGIQAWRMRSCAHHC